MATVIKPKRSETSGSAPTTSDLVAGEIAVNTCLLYTSDAADE